MTSKLKTDVLETVSGSGTIALTNQLSGMTSASMPSGSVIQVVQTELPSASGTTTSTTPVSSGLTATITPSSTTSKVMVSCQGGKAYGFCRVQLRRGSTIIPRDGWYTVAEGGGNAHSGQYLDAPSSTAAITYSVWFRSHSGGTAYFNDSSGFGMPTLTLTEIKG